MGQECNIQLQDQFPSWVPAAARHYLTHTEAGVSIRELARSKNCHPSTVLRQVRRFETSRDDPLIDDALQALKRLIAPVVDTNAPTGKSMTELPSDGAGSRIEKLSQEQIEKEAKRVLRRMCEAGAVLAVAKEMETAVVVKEDARGASLRTAMVEKAIAQAMAVKSWIAPHEGKGRVSRYYITNAGRAAFRRLTAKDENAAHGFAEMRATFDHDGDWGSDLKSTDQTNGRYKVTESPLIGLSRRRDKDGSHFLSKELVDVGERLREDFELARMDQKFEPSLDAFLSSAPLADGSKASAAGHMRVRTALISIGAGLADVVFMCCCLLEGLEQTEKKMGWSARSGKIVLRIALQRLQVHYAQQGQFAPLIG